MAGIKAEVDGDQAGEARSTVKAVVPLDAVDAGGGSHPHERHYTVTHEGLIVDVVVGGRIVCTRSFEHHDLIDWG